MHAQKDSKSSYYFTKAVKNYVLGTYPRMVHFTLTGPHTLPEPPKADGGGGVDWSRQCCPVDAGKVFLEFQNLSTGQRERTNLLSQMCYPTTQSCGITRTWE